MKGEQTELRNSGVFTGQCNSMKSFLKHAHTSAQDLGGIKSHVHATHMHNYVDIYKGFSQVYPLTGEVMNAIIIQKE